MNPHPLNIEAIQKLIPQRFPFLMIDRVLEASPEKVVALKNVTVNEAHFVGHFPDQKVMPGVLMIEAIAQAGIVLYKQKFNNDKILFLISVNAKFIKPVFSGDQIRIEVIPIKMFSKIGLMHAVVFVKEDKVVECKFSFGSQDAKFV